MSTLLELEVIAGLKPVALQELERRFGADIELLPDPAEDLIRLRYPYSPQDLHRLRTVTAVYLLLHFPIPRPKALLGHEHFSHLTGQIDRVRGMHASGTFSSFRFSAAGRDSSVFDRLREALEEYTHMTADPEEADLFIRVRPAESEAEGWEVLLRTTPRPLTTRAWRVCDMLGALNATIAAAMIELSQPRPTDHFFNPMCGSGTLLIERAAYGPVQALGGCDFSLEAINCARRNLSAARLLDRVDTFVMDATRLELPPASIDVICADLPWGHQTGDHETNLVLYPAALEAWSTIAAPGARLVAITHEITLFERLVEDFADRWHLEETLRVWQGGLHPRIYRLRKLAAA